MSKGKSPSYFTQIQDTGKKLPGVGKYDIMNLKKKKVQGSYTKKEVGGGIFDAAVAAATPDFKDPVDMNKVYKSRIPSAIIFKEHAVTDLVKESKNKIKSPSPVTYKKEASYDSTQSPRVVQHAFVKTVRKNFVEEQNHKKKNFPGVGKYDTTKADKMITIGARKGWK